jgi:hypothetical protein
MPQGPPCTSCPHRMPCMHAGTTLRVHATRQIAAGEPLTISYVDLLQPAAQRQAQLLAKYGFVCACGVCAEPPCAGTGRACLSTVRADSAPAAHPTRQWRLQQAAWGLLHAGAAHTQESALADGDALAQVQCAASMHVYAVGLRAAPESIGGHTTTTTAWDAVQARSPTCAGCRCGRRLRMHAASGHGRVGRAQCACVQAALALVREAAPPAHHVALGLHFLQADLAADARRWRDAAAAASAVLAALPQVLPGASVLRACMLRARGRARMQLASELRRAGGVGGVGAHEPACMRKSRALREIARWATEGDATCAGALGAAVCDLQAARAEFTLCCGAVHGSAAQCTSWLALCEHMALGV